MMSRLGRPIYLSLLTALFAVVLVANGCQQDSAGEDKESSSDNDSQDDEQDDKEDDKGKKGEDSDEEEGEESNSLPKLPKPKACKRYAPDVSFPDSNPSSDSYKKDVSTKDFKGKVTLWIPTFDCDC